MEGKCEGMANTKHGSSLGRGSIMVLVEIGGWEEVISRAPKVIVVSKSANAEIL
jgi:hypothetical protein